VTDDTYSSELPLRGRDHVPAMVGIAQVSGHCQRGYTLISQRRDMIVEAIGAAGGEDDRMPCAAEAARDLQPETRPGAADEGGRGGGYGHGFLLVTAIVARAPTITASRSEGNRAGSCPARTPVYACHATWAHGQVRAGGGLPDPRSAESIGSP
jgi:hypothetical protein